jgi:hypothetical protein
MATREGLPKLYAESHEVVGGAPEGQPGLVSTLQPLRQFLRSDWHPPSIARGARDALLLL